MVVITLISEMLYQSPETKLFCVGDDWQAIYRFAGSDHKIMTNFESMFGLSTILKLDETFRYNDSIAHISEKFITKNPSQLKKKLKTFSKKDNPQVYLHWHSDNVINGIVEAVKCIKQEYEIKDQKLLLLSRYKHTGLKENEFKTLQSIWEGGGEIEQKTTHSSKGLESDFVIVVDLQSGHYGFPSEIQDDPILRLVLAQEDNFQDSEERRLFYVALTRAKKQVHLICDSIQPSRFAEELSNGFFDVRIYGTKINKRKCPSCSDGILIKRNNAEGEFYSCCNYPICDFKPLECSYCKSDIVLRFQDTEGNEIAECLNEKCKKRFDVCKKCQIGILEKRKNLRGDFFGCHEFKRTGCNFIKDIPDDTKKVKFNHWLKVIKNFIIDYNISDKFKFLSSTEGYMGKNLIKVEITYENDGNKINFLKLNIDIQNFSINTLNMSTNNYEQTNFKDEQELFSIINEEIIKRKSLIDISKKIDVQSRKDKENKLSNTSEQTVDTEASLLNELKVLRRTIARSEKLPDYFIFQNKTLINMSTLKPKDEVEMLKINGVGKIKLKKYGKEFLEVINKN
jgi:ssDNA-binding Zn-finger/Zn-ribbon topoisomerase 1